VANLDHFGLSRQRESLMAQLAVRDRTVMHLVVFWFARRANGRLQQGRHRPDAAAAIQRRH
jgi:hypothetical protein